LQVPIEDAKCRIVVNPEHDEGMGASFRAGIAAVRSNADAFVLALGDMPEITVEIIDSLAAVFRQSGKRIVVPDFEGRNGHPVIFDGSLREELLQLGGDTGARRLIHNHPELVGTFRTKHRGVVYDVDTPEEVSLRHLVFDDVGTFQEVKAALSRAGIYFEAGDAEPGSIGYHAFDEVEVTALCRGGRRAEQ
jgi:CTP:molybdopterin cytidylyltransferase MocA